MHQLFEINVDLRGNGEFKKLEVKRSKKTFRIYEEGIKIMTLENNRDRSWKIAEGNIEQSHVDAVGKEIDQYFTYINS